MAKKTAKAPAEGGNKANIFSLLKPYSGMIAMLIIFALLSNGVNLLLPKIISRGIDDFSNNKLDINYLIWEFALATVLVFAFTYLQSIVQTYASEKVGRDLRSQLSAKISRQDFGYIQEANPSKLLTNLTSDIDSIKLFVSMAVVSLASSIFIIVGGSILLLSINWKLGLAVIGIIPAIGITFFIILGKVRTLFKKTREVIDWLNKVINESIMGSAIIRVINSQILEYNKFLDANTNARDLGLAITRLFAVLIPIIIFVSNIAMLTILVLGGHFVISGSMSLGDFAAFNSYLAMLIFPILIIGFMSNLIAMASASYQRIYIVLSAVDKEDTGIIDQTIHGHIELKDVSMYYGQKPVLKDVSFSIEAGSRTAIIGPTAAGKTQLLNLLSALTQPQSGTITYDGKDINTYMKDSFFRQMGIVFQESVIFNMSIRENIAFSDLVTDQSLEKAINTAELRDFITSLPDGLSTVVSERGSSLSGGQKQRIMLARALAINPKVLLLDDFTARVDNSTEQKILDNVQKNYPDITLLSVTQKISSVEHYDQIILLMEGEMIAKGTHEELMNTCPEYVQIYDSQRSTANYEL